MIVREDEKIHCFGNIRGHDPPDGGAEASRDCRFSGLNASLTAGAKRVGGDHRASLLLTFRNAATRDRLMMPPTHPEQAEPGPPQRGNQATANKRGPWRCTSRHVYSTWIIREKMARSKRFELLTLRFVV